MSLIPTLSTFSYATTIVHFAGSEMIYSERKWTLHPNQMLSLSIEGYKPLTITHLQLADALNRASTNSSDNQSNWRFYEENDDIDFSSLDIHSAIVPLMELSVAPPNVDGYIP